MPTSVRRRCLSAPLRWLAAALLLAAAAVGCSTVPRAPVLAPQAGAPREVTSATATATAAISPWQVPAAAYGSQILYRVGVAGPEGEGSLKLTLRLASPERYQAQAVDPLGRAVWGLDVEGDRGLWLDHRGHRYCRLSGALDLAFLPLGPLSLSALPPLLLGRLPVPPADPAIVSRGSSPGGGGGGGGAGAGGDTVAYHDAAGRGWSAALRGGQVVSWGLWQDTTPAPILSWTSSGSWSVLSDRRKGVEVRWQEAVREPLRALVPMTPRSDYRQSTCTAATAPASPGAGSF
ncbi:MAG TPA: hypothetical protein VHB47_00420 [Thermoanaerobaculia bacterium]|nr:hypothetical protein [Thermoanaerobaculia bacterium]